MKMASAEPQRQAQIKAAERMAEFAKGFSLRAKNDPELRIAYAEIESEMRKRCKRLKSSAEEEAAIAS